jgi:hypothetical protein
LVITKFQAYVGWRKKYLDAIPANMHNAKQSNVNYSMESQYILAERGNRKVVTRGADTTSHLTVMQCVFTEIKRLIGSDRGCNRREMLAPSGYPVNCLYAVQGRYGWTKTS